VTTGAFSTVATKAISEVSGSYNKVTIEKNFGGAPYMTRNIENAKSRD
jgi:hypothetical protein